MKVFLHILGSLLVAGALAYSSITLFGLPVLWAGIASLIIIGLGLMGAARDTPDDPSSTASG